MESGAFCTGIDWGVMEKKRSPANCADRDLMQTKILEKSYCVCGWHVTMHTHHWLRREEVVLSWRWSHLWFYSKLLLISWNSNHAIVVVGNQQKKMLEMSPTPNLHQIFSERQKSETAACWISFICVDSAVNSRWTADPQEEFGNLQLQPSWPRFLSRWPFQWKWEAPLSPLRGQKWICSASRAACWCHSVRTLQQMLRMYSTAWASPGGGVTISQLRRTWRENPFHLGSALLQSVYLHLFIHIFAPFCRTFVDVPPKINVCKSFFLSLWGSIGGADPTSGYSSDLPKLLRSSISLIVHLWELLWCLRRHEPIRTHQDTAS